jgi:hypothetical protein
MIYRCSDKETGYIEGLSLIVRANRRRGGADASSIDKFPALPDTAISVLLGWTASADAVTP